MTGPGQSPGRQAERQVTCDDEIELLLGTLEDPDCRAMIEATDNEALSASELSDECELPLSTVYRKLDRLTDVGILEEQIRICKSGQHTSEYRRVVDSIELSVCADSGIELLVSQHPVSESGNSMVAGAD